MYFLQIPIRLFMLYGFYCLFDFKSVAWRIFFIGFLIQLFMSEFALGGYGSIWNLVYLLGGLVICGWAMRHPTSPSIVIRSSNWNQEDLILDEIEAEVAPELEKQVKRIDASVLPTLLGLYMGIVAFTALLGAIDYFFLESIVNELTSLSVFDLIKYTFFSTISLFCFVLLYLRYLEAWAILFLSTCYYLYTSLSYLSSSLYFSSMLWIALEVISLVVYARGFNAWKKLLKA